MKRPFFQKVIAAGVLIGAVLGTATVAQARTEVQVAIGLPGLPVLVPPPLPRLVFRAEPVYVEPPVVYQAPPAAVYERSWGPSYRYEADREREWRHREWERRAWERREWERRHQHRDEHGWQ